MGRRALLDINLLVALFDPDHVHHEIAHDWFADHHTDGWASCPLTQNGLIRVLSDPRYGSPTSSLRTVHEAVRRFVSSKHHEFWPDDVSICDNGAIDISAMTGHKQITDVYLLALASKKRGHLVTLDRSIPVKAVAGGARALTIVEPREGRG